MKYVDKSSSKFDQVRSNNVTPDKKTIAIDLVWWNVGNMGGVESYCKNLLRGFSNYSPSSLSFILLVSENNASYIESLGFSDAFVVRRIKTNSYRKIRTMFFQYLNICRIAAGFGADLLFVPTPIYPIRRGRIPTIVTIHDLQFAHFPQYATLFQNAKYRWCWKTAVENSRIVVAISNFVKQDIVERLDADPHKIETIYNPVVLTEEETDFKLLSDRYGIRSREYLYTVSSMLPHKNIQVLIKLVSKLREKNVEGIPNDLVISGIGGSQKKKLEGMINQLGVGKNVLVTGFVSNEERDSLYRNAYAFLFPSTFEGFGMPPVEALMCGTPVITTKCASIPEVTRNKAIYVEEPYDPVSWFQRLTEVKSSMESPQIFPEYSLERVTQKYLNLFQETINLS